MGMVAMDREVMAITRMTIWHKPSTLKVYQTWICKSKKNPPLYSDGFFLFDFYPQKPNASRGICRGRATVVDFAIAIRRPQIALMLLI